MPKFSTRILDSIAPPLSIRRQLVELIGQMSTTLLKEGAVASLRMLFSALDHYRRTGALIQYPHELVESEAIAYSYAQWIAEHELSAQQLTAQAEAISTLIQRPLFSVLVPVYNPPVAVLQAALDSVFSQSYPHWELCIVNGGDDPTIRCALDLICHTESRIKLKHLERNGGISANSNVALELAAGEFIVLLDHDDTLAPNLLFEIAVALQTQPECDILYFDEDKLSADGAQRSDPWFKPEWSPDLMVSVNLLMHGVFRRSLVEAVGRFDPATDGAQDWDLALRCSEQARHILHLPKVLYHWRQIPGSAALDPDAKPWAFAAQTQALRNHLERTGHADATVELLANRTPRIEFPVNNAFLSIVIPSKDNVSLLRACIDSIRQQTKSIGYEIIVVDSGSVDPATHAYYKQVRNDPTIRLSDYKIDAKGAFNYSRANNLGAQQAKGNLLLFLNNDTEVLDPESLALMAGWAQRSQIGVVGAKLLRANRRIQHAGVIVGMRGHADHIFMDVFENYHGIFGSTEWVRNYLALSGACQMMRREVFEQVGRFDESFELAFSDVELCLRIRQAGYRNVYLPYARLLHYEGASRGRHIPVVDVMRATQTLGPQIVAGDPYFNPNLSYARRVPILSHPDEASRQANLLAVLKAFRLLASDATPETINDFEEILSMHDKRSESVV